MLAVIGLHGLFERLQGVVDIFVDGHIDFRRGSPQHHHAVALLLLPELPDVLAQLLHHVPARATFFDVGAIQPLGIIFVEGGLHGYNLFQLLTHWLNILTLQHVGIDGRLISILRIDIPAAKDDVVKAGHRYDVAIVKVFLLCSLPKTYLVIQCHRPDSLGQSLAGHQDTCHKCSCYCAVADDKDSQLARCGLYVCLFHSYNDFIYY